MDQLLPKKKKIPIQKIYRHFKLYICQDIGELSE